MKNILCTLMLASIALNVNAETVSIDHTTQRYLGDVSELDRTKYFTVHSSNNDADLTKFYRDYNVTQGRSFWGPYSYANSKTGEVGVYPTVGRTTTDVAQVQKGRVATEHPSSVLRYNTDVLAGAKWAVDYYKSTALNGSIPEIFEPMNEPFVHADDDVFAPGRPNVPAMREKMADWFAEIGKQIHLAPELANMKVIGYSSAWPSLELWNFGHWERYQKMFMDRAGEHMDGFATHLYDGINVTGQSNYRSGSNSEAILDMIEAYSYLKWGVVKPHAITEYGGIESGFPREYSDLKSAQGIVSFNNMMFNLLERENDMLISIPFITDKSTWFLNAANGYHPYGPVLFRASNLGEPNPTGWVYTVRINFYEMWKEFKGKRVEVRTNNPDIQAQAFAHNNKLYVAVNNLDTEVQNVDLNFVKGLEGLQDVRIKAAKIYLDKDPVFTNELLTSAPTNLNLIAGETVTLEYTFANNLAFDNAIRSQKYYSTTFLQPIRANQVITFNYSGIKTGVGKANIRMTIGRKHNRSKAPIVRVNGTRVQVPSNWAGYDQAGRSDFFGTIVIPFPAQLLSENSTVTMEFPDSDGHVASAILQVETYDTTPTTGVDDVQRPYYGTAAAIPGRIEIEDFDLGGQGVAYNDVDAANNGGTVYRANESVDILAGDGGRIIGWTRDTEWIEYTVNTEPGAYDIDFRVSTQSDNQVVVVKLNGNEVGTLNLPNTGSFTNFQTATLPTVILDGGADDVLRLEFSGGAAAYNWMQFNQVELPPETVGCSLLPTNIEGTNTLDIQLDYSANEARDVVAELWRGSQWLQEKRVTVDRGASRANLRFSLSEALTPSNDYEIKAAVRPVGAGWREGINSCSKRNIILAPPREETVSCEHIDNSYQASNSLSLQIGYSVNESRDVVAELWKGDTYVAERRETVSAGEGLANIALNFSSVLQTGSDYLVKAQVRAVGADWRNPVDACSKDNIAMVSISCSPSSNSVQGCDNNNSGDRTYEMMIPIIDFLLK